MAVQGQPNEKMCPQCFEINPLGATFCQLCGAAFTDSKESTEGSDQEVYRDLAQTNLLKMRGAYKEAVQVCLGILKRYPNNATAHTLLGDIYSEQGDLQQAAEWYEMALDLNPKSESDRRKLDEVRHKMEMKDKAETVEQLGIPEKAPRSGLFIAICTAAIVLVGAGAFWVGTAFQGMKTAKNETILNRPVNLKPDKKPEPTPAKTDGKEPAKEDPKPETSTPTANDGAMSASDLGLLNVLRSQGAAGTQIAAVIEDPRTPTIIVTAQQGQDATPELTASKVAVDVYSSFNKYNTITVKVVSNSNVVFVADVTMENYNTASANGKGPELATADGLFTNSWHAGGNAPAQ